MESLSDTAAILQHHEDISTDLEATQTITELQIDLQNTIAFANEIKLENVDLKKQLESANSFSKANLQRHAVWKEAWKKEREIVSKRENQLERNEATWKAKLEQQRKEWDELERRKILNSEGKVGGGSGLDVLKEIQVEYTSKTERLANEVSIV